MTKNIVKDQIQSRFDLARSLFLEDPLKAHMCIAQVRILMQKNRKRMTSVQRRCVCRNCYHYLFVGKNCTVRTNEKMLIYTCADCGNYNKFRLS
ncbi:MAG: RNase P subunit RPR2 [Candidatus Woesearchaeota archaeon]|jgi:RNase P subunit RPR2